MTNARRAALVMFVVMALQTWPLVMVGAGPGGVAALSRWIGLGAPAIAPLAWVAALATALIYAAVSMQGLPYIRRRMFSLTSLKLLGVGFALITGLFEEVFFRKWLMDLVQGQGLSVLPQIVASAVVFGLAHGIWGLLGRSVQAAINATLFTTVLGGALAGIYILADRQVAPCVWSHILINLIIEPWLILGYIERARPSAKA